MVYDFCFDELTVQDYLMLMQFGQTVNNSLFAPMAISGFLGITAKCCNIDPMALPINEVQSFLQQFNEALAAHRETQ